MFEWWDSLPFLQQLFYMIAIPSTIVLLLQTILLLFGLGEGHDGSDFSHDHDISQDFDHDGNFAPDHGMAHDQGADHEIGLRVLTVRGIIAFLSIFGWVGVAALDMGAGSALASLLALIAGLGAMVAVAAVLRASMKLQQSGNLDFHNAVGLTGEVYLPIPAGGKGKITLIMQERFQEMDALCMERSLKTGEQVKVIGINESNTLIVTPLFETVSQ